eukprot:scaffold5725_cov387-Prasinococcus_capsulatus_cf.AAC.4
MQMRSIPSTSAVAAAVSTHLRKGLQMILVMGAPYTSAQAFTFWPRQCACRWPSAVSGGSWGRPSGRQCCSSIHPGTTLRRLCRTVGGGWTELRV